MTQESIYPHPNTIKSYFGTIDIPDELNECESTINSVKQK